MFYSLCCIFTFVWVKFSSFVLSQCCACADTWFWIEKHHVLAWDSSFARHKYDSFFVGRNVAGNGFDFLWNIYKLHLHLLVWKSVNTHVNMLWTWHYTFFFLQMSVWYVAFAASNLDVSVVCRNIKSWLSCLYCQWDVNLLFVMFLIFPGLHNSGTIRHTAPRCEFLVSF